MNSPFIAAFGLHLPSPGRSEHQTRRHRTTYMCGRCLQSAYEPSGKRRGSQAVFSFQRGRWKPSAPAPVAPMASATVIGRSGPDAGRLRETGARANMTRGRACATSLEAHGVRKKKKKKRKKTEEKKKAGAELARTLTAAGGGVGTPQKSGAESQGGEGCMRQSSI